MDMNMQKNSFITGKKSNNLNKLLNLFAAKELTETGISSSDGIELLECIKNARNEWLVARSNFEYAQDGELVDYYTYKIKACEIRYQYYLKKAKQTGLKAAIELPGFLMQY